MSELQFHKVCGFGHGHDGPDLFFCIVACYEDEYNEGKHYEVAKEHLEKNYEVEIVMLCDENDPAGRVMTLMDWNSFQSDPVFCHP